MLDVYKDINKDKIVLITGGAGFIAYHLSKALLEKGLRVIGFDNMNEYYDINLKIARLNLLKLYDKYIFIKGDLADKYILEKIFNENKPNIIVNLGAQAGVRYSIEYPEAYIQSNIVGFFNVLETCRYHHVDHLIFASSSSVYGANKKVPFSEKDYVDCPVSLYAATKKSNELMAYSYSHLYDIPSTGLRFFTVYGPYGRPDMAYYTFTKAILERKSIKVFNNGDLYRDFTYINDIILGIERILFNSPGGDENGTKYKIYNIGNNKPIKLLDFIEILEDIIGKKAIKEFYPMQAGDVYKTFADIDDLEKDFDFRPITDIRIGLQNFVDWFNNYNKIK